MSEGNVPNMGTEPCGAVKAEVPKYKTVFQEFIDGINMRMQAGFEEYGDTSFDRPMIELVREIKEELFDICGWSVILFEKLKRLEEKIGEVKE